MVERVRDPKYGAEMLHVIWMDDEFMPAIEVTSRVATRDRAVTKAWQVSALPSTVVLAPDLTPRLFVEGDLDWSRSDVLATIATLYPAAARRTEPITIQTINNPRGETTR
jgi:hypothetical protein